VLLLAGLARPGSFRRTLQDLGAEVVAEQLLPDHGWLRAGDLARALQRATELGAAAVALTEKDAVRLSGPGQGPIGLCGQGSTTIVVVRVEVELRDGAQALDRALEATWAR